MEVAFLTFPRRKRRVMFLWRWPLFSCLRLLSKSPLGDIPLPLSIINHFLVSKCLIDQPTWFQLKKLIHLHPDLSLHKTAWCSPCERGRTSNTGFIQGRQHKFLKGPLISTVMSRSTISPVVFNLHESGAEVAPLQRCSVFCCAPSDRDGKALCMHKATGIFREALIRDGWLDINHQREGI